MTALRASELIRDIEAEVARIHKDDQANPSLPAADPVDEEQVVTALLAAIELDDSLVETLWSSLPPLEAADEFIDRAMQRVLAERKSGRLQAEQHREGRRLSGPERRLRGPRHPFE